MAIPWGPIISAAGSVIGGLVGGSSETVNPGKALKQTVNAARKVGIHPLAALGTTSAYQQVNQNPLGAGIAEGARAIGDAVQSSSLEKSAMKVNDAQAELLKTQAASINQEMRAKMIGGTTGARNISNPNRPVGLGAEVDSVRNPVIRQSVGKETPSSPDQSIPDMFVPVRRPDGSVIRIPNMEHATDAETDLWSAFADGKLIPYVRELAQRNGWSVKATYEHLDKVAAQNTELTRTMGDNAKRELRAYIQSKISELRKAVTGKSSHRTGGGF